MLPNKKFFLKNFFSYKKWEKKYIYIIELGKKLKSIPKLKKNKKNLIEGCQSKTWIKIIHNKKNIIHMYGDSESSIVKGLIAIIFIFYKKKTLFDILNKDIFTFLKKIKLDNHLTYSRTNGLKNIIYYIKRKAFILINKISQKK